MPLHVSVALEKLFHELPGGFWRRGTVSGREPVETVSPGGVRLGLELSVGPLVFSAILNSGRPLRAGPDWAKVDILAAGLGIQRILQLPPF